jgi:ABC-type dipeptide/oligopeptide/nickel transport system permease subunit
MGTVATLLAYVGGIVVGMVAGYSRSFVDSLLMRAVDVVLAFPPLLVLLVLLTGAGNSIPVLIAGVAVVQFPGIARIVRTATLETRNAGYVDAAIVRGEKTWAVLRREILPNITGPVLATAGLRFTLSVIFISSINYLGLGLQPPTADWGLMVSENQSILSLNSFTVLVPALMIALLTISITMVGDAVARSLGRSTAAVGTL